MPIFDYQCTNEECKFKDEFIINSTVHEEFVEPEKCPTCGGQMIRLFSGDGIGFDPGRGTYSYEHGKYAWKKKLSLEDQAKVLCNEKDPY